MQRRGCHSVLLKQFGDASHPGVRPCTSCPSYTGHQAALVHNVLSSPNSHDKQCPAYTKPLAASVHYFRVQQSPSTNHFRYTTSPGYTRVAPTHQSSQVHNVLRAPSGQGTNRLARRHNTPDNPFHFLLECFHECVARVRYGRNNNS